MYRRALVRHYSLCIGILSVGLALLVLSILPAYASTDDIRPAFSLQPEETPTPASLDHEYYRWVLQDAGVRVVSPVRVRSEYGLSGGGATIIRTAQTHERFPIRVDADRIQADGYTWIPVMVDGEAAWLAEEGFIEFIPGRTRIPVSPDEMDAVYASELPDGANSIELTDYHVNAVDSRGQRIATWDWGETPGEGHWIINATEEDASLIRRRNELFFPNDEYQDEIDSGVIVYDEARFGYVNTENGRVWRFSMSGDPEDYDAGWLVEADRYVETFYEGCESIFVLEFNPESMQNRELGVGYSDVKWSDSFKSNIGPWIEQYAPDLLCRTIYFDLVANFSRDIVYPLYNWVVRGRSTIAMALAFNGGRQVTIARVYDPPASLIGNPLYSDSYYVSGGIFSTLISLANDLNLRDYITATNMMFGTEVLWPDPNTTFVDTSS